MKINIFDFDGVLSHPIEDCVFRLDERREDTFFIELGRQRYGITNLSENVKRNRHLILQEVLYERKICPHRGPLYEKLINSTDPFYVLTARSGAGAVARVSLFLEEHKRRPEEMFFVGPVSKNHILIDLCEKFQDYELHFYDDTQYHIDHAKELGFGNLQTCWVDNKPDELKEQAEQFYKEQLEWLQSV